jgi:hypothetical protein
VGGRIVYLHHIRKNELRCFPIDRPLEMAALEWENPQAPLQSRDFDWSGIGGNLSGPRRMMSSTVDEGGAVIYSNTLDAEALPGRAIGSNHR